MSKQRKESNTSIHVVSWVLANSPVELGDRLVLIVLADHAKKDGTAAWPSVATIAEESRLSERAVQYALRNLERMGAITETGRSKQGTHIYTVNMGGAKSAGVQSLPLRGAESAPEPSLNRPTSEELRSSSAEGAKSAPLVGSPYVQFFVDETRAHAGVDPLPNAKKRIGVYTKELERLGVDDAVIREAITTVVTRELGVGAFPGVVDQVHRQRGKSEKNTNIFDYMRERGWLDEPRRA